MYKKNISNFEEEDSFLHEYALLLFSEKFFSCEIGKYYSIMPRKSKISRFDIHVIADIICECVSDISDIKFYGRGEESLCYMVRKFHL